MSNAAMPDSAAAPADRVEASFCRTCGGVCGVEVTISDDRIVKIQGDRANPLTQGFACLKGLQAPAFHYHPKRLLHPLKRLDDGSFVEIPLEQALDEIAAKLAAILQTSQPRAIAGYRGTQNYLDSTAFHMLPAWLNAFGSPSFYSTMTIDQSAKWVTADRLGTWNAGYQSFADADVWMFVGINPVVSLWGGNGFPPFNPVKRLKEARARGMTIIVIDPRHSETAQFADIFLQPHPGEDVAIAAGLLHVILAESWYDAAFCAAHVAGLEALREMVAPFTTDYVSARAGVPAALLRQAAAAFAQAGQRGLCTTGTGPNMAAHSNLSEHLYECLNVICGRYLRAGETLPNPGVTSPRITRYAEVVAPRRAWEQSVKSRIGDSGVILGQMMSGILCDEILKPGDGQIRALFVVGGNPAIAFPDQQNTVAALRALDLLVTIDPMMTATAKLSHYVLPPKLQYERPDMPLPHLDKGYFGAPYAQYTPALVPPPAGSEVVDDWYVFWALARRLGQQITYFGAAMDMNTTPTTDQLISLLVREAPIPFAELREQRRGKFFDVEPLTVAPPRPGDGGRFEVAPGDIVAEIADAHRAHAMPSSFTHRLISRRMRDVCNTMGQDIPAISARVPVNPAFFHPADLTAHDLKDGDLITIHSATGSITTPVKADGAVRRGVISMTHGWGGLPNDLHNTAPGACTSLLVTTTHRETINAMPEMSAIPVRFERISAR
jgi:anaerobic selenocysteine-containing dehydrogenase